VSECKSLDEVRKNIDRVDQEIIKLLAERSEYVRQAARFKKSAEDVAMPKRVEEVVHKVRKIAAEYKLDPDIVEQVYRLLIGHFIEAEMKVYRQV
jgi:isochorismate pyruvate lyase